MRTIDDYLVKPPHPNQWVDHHELDILLVWGRSVDDNTAILAEGYEFVATIGLDGVDVPYH